MNTPRPISLVRSICTVCLLLCLGVTQQAFGDEPVNTVPATSHDPLEVNRERVLRFPMDDTIYRSENSAKYNEVPVEMISLSLVSTGPISVALPGPGETIRADSFFDVFTEISVNNGQDTMKPVYFDVFLEVEVDNNSQGNNKATWDTEILSMSLTGDQSSNRIMIRESPNRTSSGKINIGSSGQDGFRVDSFFDIWTEVSLNGGQTWSPAEEALHLTLSFLPGGPTISDGISLLPSEQGPISDFPLPGSRYQLKQPVPVAKVDIEQISLSLSATSPITRQMLPDRLGETATFDSFFDVFTEISVDGGQTDKSDGIVFVGTWVPMEATKTEESNAESSWDTEILSMSLSGGSLPEGVIIRESEDRHSRGQLTISDIGSSGQDGFRVDSFFDVWTEISVDGGKSWVPADQAMHLALSRTGMTVIPEPDPNRPDNRDPNEPDRNNPRDPLIVPDDTVIVPRASTYESNNRASYASVEVELVALSLVSTQPVDVIPLPQTGKATQGDVFFDVFTEIRLNQHQSAFMDSFFDVFTDLRLDDVHSAFMDSFFDIFTDLNTDIGGPVETLFKVSSFALSADLMIRPHAGAGYDLTFTDFDVVPVPEIDDEVLVGFQHSSQDTGDQVFTVEIKDKDGGFKVDSFFDIWTEVSIDGGQNWLPTQGPARVELSLDRPSHPVTVSELGFPLDPSRTRYRSVNSAGHSDVGGKIVRLNLRPSNPNDTVPLPEEGQAVRIDSFFDISTIVQVGRVSHFIRKTQVPVFIGITPVQNSQDGGTWDTEILSMSLRGDVPGLGTIIIRESQTRDGSDFGGLVIESRIGPDSGLYSVDSFFDIWTEVSIDGGQFVPTGEPIRVSLEETPNGP